eukprot:1177141-Prorocentrum_minimum.AAC.3
MDVQPQLLTIPAHEHRYVTCYFTPRAIQSYSATLDVVVENGSDPKTKQFTCDLRGEGTLPNITVEAPAALTEGGAPWMKFPRCVSTPRSEHRRIQGGCRARRRRARYWRATGEQGAFCTTPRSEHRRTPLPSLTGVLPSPPVFVQDSAGQGADAPLDAAQQRYHPEHGARGDALQPVLQAGRRHPRGDVHAGEQGLQDVPGGVQVSDAHC